MTKQEFYKTMESMSVDMPFDEIHEKWHQCFGYILKSFKAGHNSQTIDSLFYQFEMNNWKAMWKENSEYKDSTDEEIIKSFCGELGYISDRASYDRLFRAHWLFLRGFEREIQEVKYPTSETV